jgi:hypothetical protein
MADPVDLQQIEQGVAVWNLWRDEHPEAKPDLSRAYLFEADLSGANLSGVSLHRACLIGVNLKGANLQGADLSGAYISRAILCDANLHSADLSEANLSEANLTGADLSYTQAKATNFTAAELTGVCLEDCQVNHTTQFDDINCRYLYLHRHQCDRYPADGEFQPDKLAQFIQQLREASAIEQGYAVPLVLSSQATSAIASQAAFQSTLESVTTAQHKPISPSLQPARIARLPASSGFALLQRKFVMGGSIVLAIAAIALLLNFKSQPTSSSQSSPTAQSSSTSAASFPILPCNEPSLPPLPDRAPDHEYKDGTRFYGKFVDGAPADGRGIMVFPSGQRYDGDYRQGKRNGCGTMTFDQGKRYTGQFSDDQFQGLGVWTLENGDRYIGEFRNNKCDGTGTFIFKDGSFQSGNWQNGNLVDGTASCNSDSLDMPSEPE